MKKNFLTLFLISFSFMTAWSQAGDLQMKELAYLTPTLPGVFELSSDTGLEGHPYLYNEWKPGKILFHDQKHYGNEVKVILNLEKNQLFVKIGDNYIGTISTEKITALKLYNGQDTSFFEVYDLHNESGLNTSGLKFHELMHRGERYTLLYEHKKYVMKDEGTFKNLAEVSQPGKYLSNHTYWVIAKGDIVKIKRSTRSLMKALPKRANTIKTINKKHKLDLKKDKDLIRMFELLEE